MPRTLQDIITPVSENRCEQARFDAISIVDKSGSLLQTGFTEVSATYTLNGPRRMHIRLLDVDYDASGHALWKALIEGDATR